MNPSDSKDHLQARQSWSKHPAIARHEPVIGPMEALVADLGRLRDQGSMPPNCTEGQFESWHDDKELYVEFRLEEFDEAHFDISVFGGKVFIRLPI